MIYNQKFGNRIKPDKQTSEHNSVIKRNFDYIFIATSMLFIVYKKVTLFSTF